MLLPQHRDRPLHLPRLKQDACTALIEVLESLADNGISGRRFLQQLANRVAGVRPGAAGLIDLAGGGTDVLRGRGFAARYDDGTTGQARHFAGIAYSTALFGARLTRLLSVRVRGDGPDSPDGHLTEAAISFSTGLMAGRIRPQDAPQWVRTTLCAHSAR
jgi:hypothetical protein